MKVGWGFGWQGAISVRNRSACIAAELLLAEGSGLRERSAGGSGLGEGWSRREVIGVVWGR